MKRFLPLLLGTLAAGCVVVSTQPLPSPTAALVNGAFDDAGSGLPGWAQRGDQFGRSRLVGDPVASAPRALELEAVGRKGSSGDDSLMVYQVLDPAPYKGKRVRFGARILTRGGAVNMTLFTPGKLANDLFSNLNSGAYVERSGTLDVPGNANFLSFGIQLFGPAGAKAYVDDVFVEIANGGTAQQRPGVPGPVRAGEGGGAAKGGVEIRIAAARPSGEVNPLLFGMHVEWAESGNGLVDAGGQLRRDPVEALAAARIPLFRFPGGIHADYYDWRPGTQPRGRRDPSRNIFNGRNEANAFGSQEFVELLKATRADALITVNYGTGTQGDAAAWARWFRDGGQVPRYWEVGNEIYLADPQREQPNGKRIAKPGNQYAADFPGFRDAIRGVSPEAKVGLIGHIDSGAFPITPAARRDWTAQMLNAFNGQADFISVHNGYAPVIINDSVKFEDANQRRRAYAAMLAGPAQTGEDLRSMYELLDRKAQTRGLPVAITEWGPLFGYSNRPDVHNAYVDQSRTMVAAVYVASMLDMLLDQPRVLLATYTNPIHKWYGSLLTDTDRGLIRTPTYHVYTLYRTRFESRLVPVDVSSPTFDSQTVGLIKARRGVPDVVARASVSGDGRRLTAIAINRSLDRTTPARLAFEGFAAARADCLVLAAQAPNAINGPNLTKSTATGAAIEPKPMPCTAGNDMRLSLPPSSVVSIVLERAR